MDENKITTGGGDREPPLPDRSGAPEPEWEREPPGREHYHPYQTRQQDKQYLNLLAIFHYIVGGFMFVCGLCPLLEVGFGTAIVSGAIPTGPGGPGQPPVGPPPEIGYFVIGLYGSLFLLMYVQGILSCLAGYFLTRRKRWAFCMVTAAINCLNIPHGTILGVFTIIVLVRESVKDLFKYGEPRSDDEDYA